MFKLWKISTMIFVFQLVVGAMAYVATDGNVEFAWTVSAAGAFILALIGQGTVVFFVALVAATCSVGAGLSMTWFSFETGFLIACIAVQTMFAANEARRKGVQGPYPLLFLTVLSGFGISTIFGGAILLLYRWRQSQKQCVNITGTGT